MLSSHSGSLLLSVFISCPICISLFGVFIMQSLSHLTVIFSLFNFFVLNNPANHNHFSVWYIYLQRKGSMNCEIQNPHPMGLGFWMKTGNQVQYWKIFFSSRYKNEYISKIMALGSEFWIGVGLSNRSYRLILRISSLIQTEYIVVMYQMVKFIAPWVRVLELW